MFSGVPESLADLADHLDCPAIERFVLNGFPFHVAIHIVSALDRPPERYSLPHVHEVPEVNLILGDPGALEYEIGLGQESHTVRSPAGVWIPAGVLHMANLKKGSGFFVCLIFRGADEARGE